MPSFKITLAYDGTPFVGWQRQASGVSVQGLLEEALAILEGAPVVVAGAGRTDAGVHALGQVASVRLTRQIEPSVLVRALNGHLPPEVRVLAIDEVPASFHARFSATAKHYRYRIWNADAVLPFERLYAWQVGVPLDADAMHNASRLLVGTHDFACFQSAGGDAQTSRRTMLHASVVRRSAGPDRFTPVAPAIDPLITIDLHGDGFLRHMVRAIAGTLVEVGRGRRTAASIEPLLASQSRALAGETAPGHGLFLVSVEYETRAI